MKKAYILTILVGLICSMGWNANANATRSDELPQDKAPRTIPTVHTTKTMPAPRATPAAPPRSPSQHLELSTRIDGAPGKRAPEDGPRKRTVPQPDSSTSRTVPAPRSLTYNPTEDAREAHALLVEEEYDASSLASHRSSSFSASSDSRVHNTSCWGIFCKGFTRCCANFSKCLTKCCVACIGCLERSAPHIATAATAAGTITTAVLAAKK